jgi:hypothetical protein
LLRQEPSSQPVVRGRPAGHGPGLGREPAQPADGSAEAVAGSQPLARRSAGRSLGPAAVRPVASVEACDEAAASRY